MQFDTSSHVEGCGFEISPSIAGKGFSNSKCRDSCSWCTTIRVHYGG